MRSFGAGLFLAAVTSCTWVFVATAATAPAAPAADAAQLATPAPVRVGRVAFVSGKAEYRAAGASAWSPAAVDYPVATGTALRIDPAGRAEFRIGPNAIDLAGGSEARIADLDDATTEIALTQGRIALHLRLIGSGESVTVDLPRGRLRLLAPGWYDIDADTAAARIAVFAGSADFVGSGIDLPIAAGRRAILSGSGPMVASTESATTDAFAEWAQARDAAAGAAVPGAVSAEITGLAALAGHGSWHTVPGVGPAWFPDGLPVGWVPYRYGRWRWIEPWGWTWIDDEPWGFAPAHYGRWADIGTHWAWLPGTGVTHPAYAPALVNFLGTPAVGVSFAEGSGPAIGWFPLAPGEVYWPRYSRDLGYIRRLNAGAVTEPEAVRLDPDGKPPVEVVNRHFANRAFATVVPRPVFVKGTPVAPALVSLPERRLANVPVLLGSPQIGPPQPPHAAKPPAVAVRRATAHPVATRHAAAHRTPAAAHARRVVARAEHRHSHSARSQGIHNRGVHNRVPAYARAPRPSHLHLTAAHPQRFSGSSRPPHHRPAVHPRHGPHHSVRRTAGR